MNYKQEALINKYICYTRKTELKRKKHIPKFLCRQQHMPVPFSTYIDKHQHTPNALSAFLGVSKHMQMQSQHFSVRNNTCKVKFTYLGKHQHMQNALSTFLSKQQHTTNSPLTSFGKHDPCEIASRYVHSTYHYRSWVSRRCYWRRRC